MFRRGKLIIIIIILPLHVEHAERSIQYGILFILSPVYEYSTLEYEHVPVSYRVHRAEYVNHIIVAASQECVSTSSAWRAQGRASHALCLAGSPMG